MPKYLLLTICLVALAGCGTKLASGSSSHRTARPSRAFKRDLNAGINAMNAKDFANAEVAFTKAIAANPGSAVAREDRGAAEYNLGRPYFHRMLSDFRRALGLQPARAHAARAVDYYNLGLSELLLGHLTRSTADEGMAIRLDPSLVGPYAAAGSAYAQLGSTKSGSVTPYLNEAVQMDEHVIRLSPQDPRGYVNLGIAYANLHQYRRAEQVLTSAIRMNPSDAVGWFNRGMVFKQAHKNSKALNDFRKALSRATNPQLAAVLHKLITQVGGH